LQGSIRKDDRMVKVAFRSEVRLFPVVSFCRLGRLWIELRYAQ